MTIGVEEIRAAFPALQRKIGGLPVAYFDGPGGTQVPTHVTDAMVDYLHHHNANTHWEYASSHETDAIISDARATLGDFLGTGSDSVVFGANMTTLTFHLSRAVLRTIDPGAWIVVTDLDHQANVAPWRYAAAENNLEVRTIRMTPDGALHAADVEAHIRPGIGLLALGAASNALGTINDLTSVLSRASEAGALTFVDAVHYAPHARVRFDSLGCDMLACSPYKFYGPHAGVLVGRPSLLQSLKAPKLDPAPDEAPDRWETGTLSHEAIAGSAAAVNFLADCSPGASRGDRLDTTFGALHERGQALLERLWEGLSSIRGVRLYGPTPDRPRTPTVGFVVEGVPSSKVAAVLSERHAVFVSHGDFYASRVTATLGLGSEGLVRAGCACYTTAEEVDRLVRGVREVTGH